MTTNTPAVLTLYREPHVIDARRELDQDWQVMRFRCAHDGLHVHQEKDGGWRHDASEVAELARIERGETIAW